MNLNAVITCQIEFTWTYYGLDWFLLHAGLAYLVRRVPARIWTN